MTDVIILAGGIGSRVKSAIPKQFIEIDGCPIIVHTIKNFQDNANIDHIIIVCLEKWIEYTKEIVKKYHLDKWLMLFREEKQDITPPEMESIF